MAGQFEPPPTYALPVEVNAQGQQQFNPIWINWFYKLVRWLNAGGGVTPSGGTSIIEVQTFTRDTTAMALDGKIRRLTSNGQLILASQVFGD